MNNYCKTTWDRKISDEKNEILMLRKALLWKVKGYIDNHLNHVKKYLDPKKENFVQPLSTPEILAEFQIADDNYESTFYINGWWFWTTSEEEAKFLFYKQLCQWWIERVANKYGHHTMFSMSTKQWHSLDKVFKNGPSKI